MWVYVQSSTTNDRKLGGGQMKKDDKGDILNYCAPWLDLPGGGTSKWTFAGHH
jgi:hypothetical protein